jgi:hypothetical protein
VWGLKVSLKIWAWVGAGFLLISTYYCFRWIELVLPNLQPLVLPASLVPGTITTPTIRADFNKSYQIDVQFERKFEAVPVVQQLLNAKVNPFPGRVRNRLLEGIQCLLGAEGKPEECKGIESLIDITWELREGQRVVAEGNSHQFDYGFEMTDKIVRTIGMFNGQKGQRYTLVLHINRDASVLNVTEPKIVVHVPYDYWDDVGMAAGFIELYAAVTGLIGLALVYPAARRWVTRRWSKRNKLLHNP